MPQPPTTDHGPPATGTFRLNRARLEELVEEATVDCYKESEQVTGLFHPRSER